MALELLRLEILQKNQFQFCCNDPDLDDISVQEASSVLLGLQMLERLRGNKSENVMLSDNLFSIIFSSYSLHIDKSFSLCQCFLNYLKQNTKYRKLPLVYKPESRKLFKIVQPEKHPKTVVPSIPNVEYLARNPTASRNITGWEMDHWFFNSLGAHFIEFWKSTHLTKFYLTELDTEQQLTAVLYYSLQHCSSLIEDYVELFYTKTMTENSLQEFIQQASDVLKVCLFLSSSKREDTKPLQKFIDGYQLLIENIWNLAEDLNYGSNLVISTEILQKQLEEASYYRNQFLHCCLRLYQISDSFLNWKKGYKQVNIEKQQQVSYYQLIDLLSQELHKILDLFAYIDKACGSLNLMIPNCPQEYQGLQNIILQQGRKLQHPFKGIYVEKPKNIQYYVEWKSIPQDLLTMQTWNEVEKYFLDTTKPSKGAGIAFLCNKRILLPLSNSSFSIQDKWIGGKVESNETWIDAAWREFDEETFVRADPWVDFVKVVNQKNCRKMYYDDEKEEPWMNLDDVQKLKHYQVWMIAVENNLQIERHVKCNEPYEHRRISTRDIIRTAFNTLTPDKKSEFLQKIRLIVEKSDNNRKTYNTLLIPLEPLLYQPRITSIIKIPTVFPMYSSEIQRYAEPCFADVFATEPLKLDVKAMKNNEHPGFEWVKFETDERLDRIKKAMKFYT